MFVAVEHMAWLLQMADSNYVCTLDERTLEKAKKELHEDPKDRLNAVDALRTWIQQQPHITFQTGQSTVGIDVATSRKSSISIYLTTLCISSKLF